MDRISVHELDVIPGLLERFRLPAGIFTYRAIAAELTRRSGTRVTTGVIHRYGKHGIEPIRNNAVRAALGLPALAPAPVCPVHGVVHLAKRCPAAKADPKPRRNWRETALVLRELVKVCHL